ncbi:MULTISPECIES: hypothetical protein [Streptomyces]|uniref:Uncharacterized protein n=1 Tax=Streptomyces solicathayae TaxID=3081768 RepID=A0ABZ0LU14_9ACTN|nr:hypothetical protein [Streptomyces sp. HUAS YS2]WOX22968.1 hypothetical protein R2D22_16800 [Streptomyces sp. HUAS YS2]
MGVVVVAAAVVLGLTATGVDGSLAASFQAQICKAMGGSNCDIVSISAPGSNPLDRDKAYRPALCNTRTEQTDSGQEVKVAVVKLGSKFTMKREDFTDTSEKLPDGSKGTGKRIMITVQDSGEAGLETGIKGKLGSNKAKVLELGAGVEVKDGDTWVFTNEKEAQEFQDKVKSLQDSPPKEIGKGFLRVFGVDLDKDERNEFSKKYKDNHITTEETKVKGKAELGLEGEVKQNAYGISGAVDVSGMKRTQINNWLNPPVISTTRDFEISGKGKAGWGANALPGTKLKGEAGAGINGAITVTRYSEGPNKGKLARIDVVQTITKEGSLTKNIEASKEEKQGKHRKGNKHRKDKAPKGTVKGGLKDGLKEVETTTTTLAFPPESEITPEQREQRDMVEKAIGEGNNDIVGASEGKPNVDGKTLTGMMTDPPPATSPDKPGTPFSQSKNPYARLLHDSAIATRTVHSVDVGNKEGGFELKAGLSLGYTTKLDSETADLETAEFLGAPSGPDGTRSFTPIDACS